MSVAILGNRGIDTIALAAYTYFRNDPQTTGQWLYQRNVDAWNMHYNEHDTAPKFQQDLNYLNSIEVLGAVSAYRYQVADLDDPELFKFLNKIEREAIAHLDGYDDAWHLAFKEE